MTVTDRHLPRGALYLVIGQGTFLLIGYLLHAFLARSLTPALYGVFGVVMVILGWAEITVNNGVPSALQKYLPDAALSEFSVRRAAIRSQAVISVGVFLALFLTAPLLANLLQSPHLTGYLRLAFLDILVMGAYAYYRGVLNGWRAFRQLSLTIAAYSLSKLVAIFLLVYAGFGVQGALVGNIVASFGGLVVGYLWIRRREARTKAAQQMELPSGGSDPAQVRVSVSSAGGHDHPPDPATGKRLNRGQLLAFVLPAVLFTLASNLLLGLDLMGVEAFVGDPDQVGYYAAAVNLANAPRLVLLAFSFALLPSLSHAISAQNMTQTRHYLQQTIRLLALVLLPILALVTATARPLVAFVFSAAYLPAAPILTVLIFAYASYTIYITLVTSLLAENKPRQALTIPALLLPVAVVLVWLGIAKLGAMGAAFAALVSVGLAAIVVVVYVFHRFRPVLDVVSLIRILLASLVVFGVARLWMPSGLALVLGYGLLAVLYLLLLLALREFSPRDLALVRTWFSHSRSGTGA
ncbi:lipopolysaccharide biosynthesis protein [Chloroflexota bacterium]